jgi:hypothetical protein
MPKHHISIDTSKIFPPAMAPTPIPADIAARLSESEGMGEAAAQRFAIELTLEVLVRAHPVVGISAEVPAGYAPLNLAREAGRHWRR